MKTYRDYRVQVTEGGSVSCLWYYEIDVEASSKEEAEQIAADRVRTGDAEPYDSKTGDVEDSGDIDHVYAMEV